MITLVNDRPESQGLEVVWSLPRTYVYHYNCSCKTLTPPSLSLITVESVKHLDILGAVKDFEAEEYKDEFKAGEKKNNAESSRL